MIAEAPSAEIDLDALRHNLSRVRNLAPDNPVMAVVKANAYGHGLCRAISVLGDADALAVARVGEGVDARQCGFGGRVVVLEGVQNADEVSVAARDALDLVVHHESQLELLESCAQSTIATWIKFDTGMNRLGFDAHALADVARRLRRCEAVDDTLRLMTHFACAELSDHPLTALQLKRFARQNLQQYGVVSLANSAAILGWPQTRLGWLRPGLMLYGISPFPGSFGIDFDLKPVMHFRTRLIAVKPVRSGATVGYCGTWTAPRKTFIGIAAVGYGDGYPGNMPSGTPVLVNGQRVSLAGRVSMDMLAVDLGSTTTACVGDEMVLWGKGLPVEEVATACGRIPYELVCGVSRRVPRIAVAAN